MSIYSELNEIPTSVTYRIGEGGRRLSEINRQVSKGPVLIREIEAELMITVPVAEALVNWLNDKITQAKALIAEASSGTESTDNGEPQ